MGRIFLKKQSLLKHPQTKPRLCLRLRVLQDFTDGLNFTWLIYISMTEKVRYISQESLPIQPVLRDTRSRSTDLERKGNGRCRYNPLMIY